MKCYSFNQRRIKDIENVKCKELCAHSFLFIKIYIINLCISILVYLKEYACQHSGNESSYILMKN